MDDAAPTTTLAESTMEHVDVNIEAALALVDGDRELLQQVAALFCDDCPRLLAEIASALERGDLTDLRLAAHALRGSATNFGGAATASAAKVLEGMGRSGDLTGAPEALQRLRQTTERLRIGLSELACLNP
jgi:HPt (histidine-containing phosphotransfer) domain-containing protein